MSNLIGKWTAAQSQLEDGEIAPEEPQDNTWAGKQRGRCVGVWV